MQALLQFTQDQIAELSKQGFFKSYTSCRSCGTKFIFKNNNLATKKFCLCQSDDWIINNVIEC